MTTLRSAELKARLAARHAGLFNGDYPIGTQLMHIPRPGAKPTWTRTSSEAFEMAGRAMVYLANRLDPVETDTLYPAPPELTRPEADYLAARGRTLRAVLLFAAGFASAVALAFVIPPARSADEVLIMMDCDRVPTGPAPAQPIESRHEEPAA